MKKSIVVFLALILLFTSFVPILQTPLSPQQAQAADSCSAEALGDLRSYLSARVGGVALDQAAVFLADMSDITGAYYDADQDRVVFVGTKGELSVPKFDRDDLAVAIRALVFNNSIPSVSMEFKDPNNAFGDPNLNVLYYGGIEDTRFGQVLVDADYDMKIYSHGYDENGNRVVSSVPGYKSFFDRWIEKIQGKTPKTSNYSRFWISPQLVSLKKDDTQKAFVFDTVKMQIETEGLRPDNDPEWNQAAIEFSAQQTDLYDQFAQETESYHETKQLAKIVAVVKWIQDNSIVNNFEWARDYQPKYVATPREIKRLTTPYVSNGTSSTWAITGGVVYDEPNVYTPDGILASSIKTSSEAVGTPTEANNWKFMNNGQQYEAVAVAANAFRSLGAYSKVSTDLSFPTVGDLSLTFARWYSSFSGGQKGIGRGWDFMPAKLYDNKTGLYVNCTTGAVGTHPWKLGLITQSGLSETFTYTSCTTGYSSDKPEYHSKLFHNSDGTFTARLKDQAEYLFDANFRLTTMRDKNANTITYVYDSTGKITSIKDSQNHEITISNSQGLITSVADWSGRSVQYGYDEQGNLVSVRDPNGNVTLYTYDANFKLTSITDRNNQLVLTNTYTDEAKIATQKDASGTVVNFTYDEATKTISAIDNNGRTGRVLYDDKSRVLENTDPLNGIIKYTYGNEYAPLTITDKKGNKLTYTYDANGNPTSVTIPTSKKISYEYNTNNFITRILDGRYGLSSKETKFTYDAKNNITQTSEAGRLTNFTYDPLGQILTLTNPLNQKTTWTRDSFGNKLTEVDALNNTATFTYDAIARLIKITDPDLKATSYTYDNNSNLLTQADAVGTTTNTYDKENRMVKTTLPNSSITDYAYNSSGSLILVTDPLNNLTSYGYDSYQNLISQQDALNRTTLNIYDQLDRETQSTTPLGKVSKWEYDQNGNITKRTDANNNSTTYTYDSLNRLTKISYPNATSVSYTYDDRNNLTKITDLVGSTSFTYDTFDRLTKTTNPYSKSISYTYDNADNLSKVTYPDSRTVAYAYNGTNRLTSATDWNSGKTNYTYQKNGLVASKLLPNGIVVNYTYNNANQLVSLVYEKAGTTLAKFVYERDSLGNITKATEEGSFFTAITPTPTPTQGPTPTPTPTSAATPTPTPTPTSVVTPTPTPSGSGIDLVITGISISIPSPKAGENFDVNVTVKNVGSISTSSTTRVGIYYDRATAPTATTIYNDTESYYDPIAPGQSVILTETLTDFSTSGSHNIWAFVDRGNSIVESNETNNAFGPFNVNVLAMTAPSSQFAKLPLMPFIQNLFKIPTAYAQQVFPQFVSSYLYDALGRITSAQYPNNLMYSYEYDAVDNRTKQNANSAATNYTYNQDNHLTQAGTTTYSYNANGSLISKNLNPGTQSLLYDFENRPTSFVNGSTTTTYRYDGLGNRLEKKVGSTTTRFVNDISGDLSKVIAETNSLNSITNWYSYGLGIISLGSSSSSNRLYPLTDGLGNVRFVSNNTGTKVKSYDYDPFGNMRATTGTAANNYQFSTEQLDPESGLYFLRARYYDSQTGRFITKDPVKGILSNPQSQNPYAYALNNPVNLSDPSGEFAFIPILLAAWAVAEIGLTASDAIDFANTLNDPNANLCDKAWSGALFAAGVVVPGGGYGKAIKIGSRLKHVFDGHTVGGVGSIGNSIFSGGEDIVGLIKQAEKVAPQKQSWGSNFQRIIDAGRTIGTDRITGKSTSIYTIITDQAGNLITAFPGTP